MDKISIIIPIYNVEKYVERCLDSVLSQTYTNWEAILVNDGSPDQSAAIAQKFVNRDERFQLIHQENAGLSEARNTGLQYITGDFVAFLDSDDWLEKDALAYLHSEAIQKEADIVVGGIYRTNKVASVSSEAKHVEVLSQEEYAKRYFKIDSQTIEYYVWNKLYRREVVESVRYPKGFYAEDVPTTFRYILNAKRIVVSDKIVIHYFVNIEGLTAQFSKKQFDVLKGWDMVVVESEKSKQQNYIQWARFNRKRADFALLTELAMAPNFSVLKGELRDEIRRLEQNLKENARELLRSNISLSRKILVACFSINYNFFARCLNLALKVKRG
ncbi:glycosyltransferase [Streptococcus suis]|nr:glycosyltransferase [Streptococcus suis]